MINKAGNFVKTEKRPLRNGPGEIILNHHFVEKDMFGKCRLCAELVIEPGCGIGRHDHTEDMEIFYVIEGELISVNDNGSEEPFRKGDCMLTGGGATHCLRNDTDKRAVMLAFIAM